MFTMMALLFSLSAYWRECRKACEDIEMTEGGCMASTHAGLVLVRLDGLDHRLLNRRCKDN